MFESHSTNLFNGSLIQQAHIAYRSEQLYEQVCQRNWLSQVWATLRGQSRRLLDLSAVQANGSVQEQRYIGTTQVHINHIQGSSNSGRCRDFDADFRPLKRHSRSRWLSIAIARQSGVKLPPIELVQVDETYFVKDGHHRISVARALGDHEIEAEVTVVASAPLGN